MHIVHDNWRRERFEETETKDLRKDLRSVQRQLRELDFADSQDEDLIGDLEDEKTYLESELFERDILEAIPNCVVVAETEKAVSIVREINWQKMMVLTIYGWSKFKWIKLCKSVKETQQVVGV